MSIKKLSIVKQCNVALTWGEFFDRLTISIRKRSVNKNYAWKVDSLLKVLIDSAFPQDLYLLLGLVCELQMVNTDIWNLESDIRKGKEGKLGESEVGRRAIAIRKTNARRIELVNQINAMYGETEKETKYDHVSEGVSK